MCIRDRHTCVLECAHLEILPVDFGAVAPIAGDEPVSYTHLMCIRDSSYTVGPYTIEWDGSIVGEDITPLKDFLIENDYAKAEDFEAQAECQETHAEVQAPDSEAPCASDEDVNVMFIKTPAPDLTVPDLKNLVFMLYTKQFLLNRAFGKTLLTISEHLITRLQEYTPESLDEFQAILQDAHALDFLSGFSYEDGKVEMAFPLDVREPEKWPLYSELLNLIIRCAMVTKRTKPVLQKPENERYYMHSWLIRLGCGCLLYTSRCV